MSSLRQLLADALTDAGWALLRAANRVQPPYTAAPFDDDAAPVSSTRPSSRPGAA